MTQTDNPTVTYTENPPPPRRGRPRKVATSAPSKPRNVRKETIVVERCEGNSWFAAVAAAGQKTYPTTADAIRDIRQGVYGKGVLRVVAIKAPLMKVEEVNVTQIKVSALNEEAVRPTSEALEARKKLLTWEANGDSLSAYSANPDANGNPRNYHIDAAMGGRYRLSGDTIGEDLFFEDIYDAKTAAEAHESQIRAAIFNDKSIAVIDAALDRLDKIQ
jgi:hypothetical protein